MIATDSLTSRLARVRGWRPSRRAVVDLLTALGGSAAIIATIAGLDEIAGRLTG
jgi:hypothetical protein